MHSSIGAETLERDVSLKWSCDGESTRMKHVVHKLIGNNDRLVDEKGRMKTVYRGFCSRLSTGDFQLKIFQCDPGAPNRVQGIGEGGLRKSPLIQKTYTEC